MARQMLNFSCSSRNEMEFNAFRPTARALSTSVAYRAESQFHAVARKPAAKKAPKGGAATVKKIDQMKKIMTKKQQDNKKSLQAIKKIEAAMKAQVKKDMQDKKRLDALAIKAKKEMAVQKKAAAKKKTTVKKVIVKKTQMQYEEYRASGSRDYYY